MAAHLPPAPQLSGDSTLEVFVHHSASAQGARLRLLGEPLLKLAYMRALTEKRPNLRGNQLENYVNINYPVFVTHWVNAYGWRARILAVPQDLNGNFDDAEELRTIFEIYAGAVMKDCRQPGDPRGDPNVLFGWIRELVYISD